MTCCTGGSSRQGSKGIGNSYTLVVASSVCVVSVWVLVRGLEMRLDSVTPPVGVPSTFTCPLLIDTTHTLSDGRAEAI